VSKNASGGVTAAWSTAAIVEFLAGKVSLFKHLPAARLEEIAAGSRLVTREPKEAIIEFGEEPRFLGVMLAGEATASVIGDGGERQVLGRLQAGEVFGEIALMSGDRTMADVIAERRCTVLEIPVPLFQAIIMAEPKALQHVSRLMTERFRAIAQNPAASRALRAGDDPYGLRLQGARAERILVVNCGSSSLKYSFYDTATPANDARGSIERIGLAGTRHTFRGPRGELLRDLPQGTHAEAFDAMLAALVDREMGVLAEASQISLVGHRVVHGGIASPRPPW